MNEINPSEETVIPFNIMEDGNADMHHISRAAHAALEYYRIGTKENVNATPEEIEMGMGIIQSSMLPFALECALKGLLQALRISFPFTHDLLCLFNKLPTEKQDEIQTNWTLWTLSPETQKTTFRDFIEMHKDDFAKWRYLEGKRLESCYMPWFVATEAVHATTRGESQQQTSTRSITPSDP